VLHCIITRGGISDVLNSHYKKNTEGGEKTKKMRMEKGNREANRYNYGYYGISIFLLKYASYVKKNGIVLFQKIFSRNYGGGKGCYHCPVLLSGQTIAAIFF
jgi:hypothetical protein